MNPRALVAVMALASSLAGGATLAAAEGDAATAEPAFRWSGKALGVCWEGSPRPIGEAEMAALAEIGPNAISQTPFAWMSDPKKPVLRTGEGGWWGESEEGVRATARLARAHGIATLLKPHIWLHGSWPGEVEMSSEEDWAAWFEQYRAFALRWARVARDEGLEGYCIGTELDKTALREKEWRALIAEVRAIYPGLLTYAANWTDFEKIPFWDALDAIGVNAYFPLSEETCPEADALVAAWKPVAARMKTLSDRVARPIVFTEIGYHSACGAYARPWEWRMREAKPHPEDQLAGYEAVGRVFFGEPWFGGVFWWKWHAQPRRGRSTPGNDTEFTPQGKPALQWIKKRFAELRPREAATPDQTPEKSPSK